MCRVQIIVVEAFVKAQLRDTSINVTHVSDALIYPFMVSQNIGLVWALPVKGYSLLVYSYLLDLISSAFGCIARNEGYQCIWPLAESFEQVRSYIVQVEYQGQHKRKCTKLSLNTCSALTSPMFSLVQSGPLPATKTSSRSRQEWYAFLYRYEGRVVNAFMHTVCGCSIHAGGNNIFMARMHVIIILQT